MRSGVAIDGSSPGRAVAAQRLGAARVVRASAFE
jgi:hypothetical protein